MGILGQGRGHVSYFFGKSLTWLVALIRNFTGKVDERIYAEMGYFRPSMLGEKAR
jgi:hypothetical protein